MPIHAIFCGLDRTGKSSMIQGVRDQLGFMTAIHYSKPAHLKCYGNLPTTKALQAYQQESFTDMFKLLSGDVPLLLDRAHLGELVYSQRYRGYSGDYVLELEQRFPEALSKTLLVLLTTDELLERNLVDDGLSFDWSARGSEQLDFIDAFIRSSFPHKLMLNVGDGRGNFRSKDELTTLVVQQMKAK
jgi:hypothetical protein